MSDMDTTNKNVIWGWALAAGVVAFLILKFLMSYTFWPALLLAVLIAILVAILIWIGFYRETEEPMAALSQPAKAKSADTEAVQAKATPKGLMGDAGNALVADRTVKPAGLDAPRGGKPDDLKRIKGVGPKLEDLLHTMGYYHFDQIAAWQEAEVNWVDENLKGFKGRVSRDNWVEQASLLAGGGDTEFSKRVDKGEVY